MNGEDKVAVCSRTFSKNPILRSELQRRYKYITFNDAGLQLSDKSLVNFLSGHTKAIIALEKITDEILACLPELKTISKYGVGLDMLDLDAMIKRGLNLGWIGGVNRRSVAELTLSLIINTLRGVTTSNNQIRNGQWQQYIGRQLTGKTVGIVGCGHVGSDLIKLLKPFSCNIILNDIKEINNEIHEDQVRCENLEILLRESEVITLHVPLTYLTAGMIGKKQFEVMRPDAVLINNSRGGIVDEASLKDALLNNKIAAAAFDVFGIEPPIDQELLTLANFIATPHIGGSAIEAIVAMGYAAIDSLQEEFYVDINSIQKVTTG